MSALLFFVTRTIPHVCPGHNAWMISSLLVGSGLLLVLSLFAAGYPDLGIFVFKVSSVGWAAGLYRGVSLFLYKPQNLHYLLTTTAIVLLLLGLFQHIYPEPFYSALVFSLYAAGCTLALAWKIYWAKPQTCSKILYTLMTVLIIISLHLLDFPFLYDHPLLSPVGFFLAMILTVTINLLLAALTIHKFRAHLEAFAAAALDSASHDPLTGLYNRSGLHQIFRQKIRELNAGEHSLLVMFIDLDGFKQVNDTYGHQAGDHVLNTVARRLRSHTHCKKDILARFGGDEFVVILQFNTPNISHSIIQQISQRLLRCIRQPIQHEQHSYRVSGSIGISRYPWNGENLDALLLQADTAMYQAKQAGANTFRIAPVLAPETAADFTHPPHKTGNSYV
ncbi:MAG: GGDEF domain-containing protein [Thiolinea sp.]